MKKFLIIDPALKDPYLKFYNGVEVKDFSAFDDNSIWSKLNHVLHSEIINKSEICIFINFGPGSYTGLKLSKIFAEIFNTKFDNVYVFYQQSVLLLEKKFKIFVSPAYKGQLFISHVEHDTKIENMLIELTSWGEHCNKNQITANDIISSVENLGVNGNDRELTTIKKVYNSLNLDQLLKISHKYKQQEILYYRVETDDYKPTINI